MWRVSIRVRGVPDGVDQATLQLVSGLAGLLFSLLVVGVYVAYPDFRSSWRRLVLMLAFALTQVMSPSGYPLGAIYIC